MERLDVGRKVAFKAPPKKDPDTGRMEAAQWILATVKAFLPPNKCALCFGHFHVLMNISAAFLLGTR